LVRSSALDFFDGARMQCARQRAGFSLQSLAEQVVVASGEPVAGLAAGRRATTLRKAFGTYEAGKVKPRPRIAVLIAKVLGVDLCDLLDPEAPIDIRIRRARLAMTQADVAEELGLSVAAFARAERGEAGLDGSTAARLDQLLVGPSRRPLGAA
jgi:transcriptional regulator with XRE-family HTH domain